ncbi:MAG TPA: hypothetical protein VHA76_10875 [Solirubrobacterales bacterium]|nr:hypothetical protein [Solirubrobacterales bacterium]
MRRQWIDAMDYEIQRCTRHCAVSGREFNEGEEFYSVLVAEGSAVRRYDYALDAWSGAPEKALGFWKSRMPAKDASASKPKLAPGEVMLQLFTELEGAADKADMRYVLALLMIRRRLLRLEETQHDEAGQETLSLYCPRDENLYEIPVVMPDEVRAQEIQEELGKLLFASSS